MIIEKTGDLFRATTQAIGHGVNCRGLMGAGIAKDFRRRWPEMYSEYRKLCDEGILRPGQIYPYRVSSLADIDYKLMPPWYVINIASQEHPGPDASYVWLEQGVEAALKFCTERHLESLALPQIGCGIGGLSWETAREVLERVQLKYDVTLEVWSL